MASHSKLLALLTTNVAMDYLEKHERTARTSRNLCPNKFGAQGSGVQSHTAAFSRGSQPSRRCSDRASMDHSPYMRTKGRAPRPKAPQHAAKVAPHRVRRNQKKCRPPAAAAARSGAAAYITDGLSSCTVEGSSSVRRPRASLAHASAKQIHHSACLFVPRRRLAHVRVR